MADEKDSAENRSWQEIGERGLEVGSDLLNASRKLATADVDTIFRNLLNLIAPVQKSIDEIAEECARQIDGHILDKEKRGDLKFSAGQFKITWGNPKFSMALELYYQDSDGKWQKETASTEVSVRRITEESRRELEKQKEKTFPIEHPGV